MGWDHESPEGETPFFSGYPSHHICPCLPTLCQPGQAGMSIPDLSLRKGAFPSLHFQPLPEVTWFNGGVLALETFPRCQREV